MIKINHKFTNDSFPSVGMHHNRESFIYYGKDCIEFEVDFKEHFDATCILTIKNFMSTVPLQNCRKIVVTNWFYMIMLSDPPKNGEFDKYYYKDIPFIMAKNLTDPYLDKT